MESIQSSGITPGFKIPVLDHHGFVQYVDHMGSDDSIAAAARVSYVRHNQERTSEENFRLLSYLYQHRHTSPFEMGKIIFNIKMPIFVARQYVRHRMQNMNEESARYHQIVEEFYFPLSWRAQDTKNKQASIPGNQAHFNLRRTYEIFDVDGSSYMSIEPTEALAQHCRNCYKLYKDLLEAGIAREMARMVLPLNTYTEIRACWDLNNLLKYLALRADDHAQWEHQMYANAMKEIGAKLFPMTFQLYETHKFQLVETP